MIIIFVLFPKIHFYQEIFDTVKFEIRGFRYVATSSPQTHPTISYLCYSSYSQIKNIFTPLKKNQNITLIMQRYKKNRYQHLILLNIFRNLNLSFTPQQPSPYHSHFHIYHLQSLQSFPLLLS